MLDSAINEPPETLRVIVRLQEMLLNGKSVASYIKQLAKELDSPVCLMDLSFRGFAYHSPVPLEDPVWTSLDNIGSLSDDYIAFNVRRHISQDAQTSSTPIFIEAADGYHAMFLCGVLVNGTPAATLGALQLDGSANERNAHILGYAARQLGSELEKHKYVGWFSPTTVAQLYLELLTADDEARGATVARAHTSGLPHVPRTVVSIPLQPEQMGGAEYLCRRIMATTLYTECLTMPAKNEVVVIGEHHPGYARDEWARSIANVLRAHSLTGAASDPCPDLSGLADALLCARAVMAAERRRPDKAGLVEFSDRRIEALRECFETKPRFECFVHPAFATLRAHDLAAHTDLEQTLVMFLIQGCSSAAAAKQLNVHRNTLRERLDKIKELTGVDLDEPRTRMELDLSLFLRGKVPADGRRG